MDAREDTNYWVKSQQRRLTRRRLLGVGAVASAGALLLACGGGSRREQGEDLTTGGTVAEQAGAVDRITGGHYEKALAPSKEELNPAQYAKRGGTIKFTYLDPQGLCVLEDREETAHLW